MRSPLIAIEGLDRTGKTTQTNNLIKAFKKLQLSHELVKFPDRTTPIGQLINRYLTDRSFELSDQSAHLLFSANRWELHDKIVDMLESGTLVLMDRYVYSGVAYSAAKGLDFQWCLNPDLGMPRPDVTIFLKFKDSASTSTREGYGDERYEVVEFQDKVRVEFDKFDGRPEWNTVYVDGKSIEQVAEEIWTIVEPYTKGTENKLASF